MNEKEKMERGYYVVNEEWTASYLNREINEIMFGMYCPEGGTGGEMAMRWHVFGENSVPCLEAFDDSWHVLASFSDVTAELGKVDNQNISQKQFCELLNKLGFKDMTQREKTI